MLITALLNKLPVKNSAKSIPLAMPRSCLYILAHFKRTELFARIRNELLIIWPWQTKHFRAKCLWYSSPSHWNMTGTSWCCAQPWMVNDSFHCSYSKSAALAPTTESSSCHQAEGKTIATDVLKNRSKMNVFFVMRTLCVVLLLQGHLRTRQILHHIPLIFQRSTGITAKKL